MLYLVLLLIALISLSSSSLALPPHITEHFIKELSQNKRIELSAGSYLSDVLLAKRIAACLQQFGDQLNEINNDLVSEPFQCLKVSAFDKRNKCLQASPAQPENCSDKTDKKISAECQSLHDSKKRRGNGIFKSAEVFCETFEANRSNLGTIYQNYAILKWTQEELENNNENASAYVFLVEEIQNNQTKRRSITQNLPALSRFELNNHEVGSTYQWLITAVSGRGIEDCIKTEVFSPILGKTPPGPPRNVSISAQLPNGNHTVNVLLQWDPPREKTCEYKIRLDKEVKSSLANVEVDKIKEPTGTNTQWFYGLEADKSYNVRITSRASHLNSFESNATQLEFKTKSCYELYDFDLAVCAPPMPEGLQARNLLPGPTTGGAALEIEWLSLTFQNRANSMEEYVIELKSMSPATPTKPRVARTYRIPGNKTKEVVGEGISAGMLLQIELRAISKGGVSPAAILHFTVTGNPTVPNTTTTNGRTEPPNRVLFLEIIAITMPVLGVGILVVALVGLVWCHFKAPQTEFNEIELQDVGENNHGQNAKNRGSRDSTIFSGSFTTQKWEIPSSKLKIQRDLDKGSFAVVYLASLDESLLRYKFKLRSRPYPYENPSSTNKQLVALKAIPILVNTPGFSKEEIMKEIRIMENFEPHPNIVALFGAYQDGLQIGLVMEYCSGGSLLTHLQKLKHEASEGFMNPLFLLQYAQQDGTSPEEDEAGYCVPIPGYYAVNTEEPSRMVFRLQLSTALSYANQIALGMEHLERARVVHRDLACRNILLVDGNLNCKVGDFGLSRKMDLDNYYECTSGIIPVKWTAIESMLHATFSTKSDVWSYGILLWEIMTLGSTPYKQIGKDAILHHLIHRNRLSKPKYCPEDMYSLMSNCWETEKEKRPSFTEIIRNLDWMQCNLKNYDFPSSFTTNN